jgi:hypothetical protein
MGFVAIAWTVALLILAHGGSPTAHAQASERGLQLRIAGAATATAQPTASVSTPAAPATNSSLGSNGLTIATILGCVTGLLGLAIGLVALIALLRGGYGPFLRTLLPGARRRMARDNRYASRGGRQERRPSYSRSARNGRDFDDAAPRRSGAPRPRTAGPSRR